MALVELLLYPVMTTGRNKKVLLVTTKLSNYTVIDYLMDSRKFHG